MNKRRRHRDTYAMCISKQVNNWMIIHNLLTWCVWFVTNINSLNTLHIVVQRKFGFWSSHCTVSRALFSLILHHFLCLEVINYLWNHFDSFLNKHSSLNAAVNIPYNLVSSVLSHHGFIQCDNTPVLKPSHLTSLIHDTYFAASKCDLFKQSVDFNLDRCTAMLANLFWNVYDPYVD